MPTIRQVGLFLLPGASFALMVVGGLTIHKLKVVIRFLFSLVFNVNLDIIIFMLGL